MCSILAKGNSVIAVGCGQRRDFAGRDLIIGVNPFERPNPQLTAAVSRAGALGVLDLGHDRAGALTALTQTDRWTREPWGVRVPAHCPVTPYELPSSVTTIVLAHGSSWKPRALEGRRILSEVTDLVEAHAALALGAGGLIARGFESGGRIGELTTYVLLQRLLADDIVDVPIWAAGGLGRHSAAAAIAGGAAGIVIDVQLALVRESALPSEVTSVIAAMDGSETTVIGRHRVYHRPDLPGRRAHWPELVAGGELPELAAAARLGSDGFDEQLLPIGQDGAFARSFAEDDVTAGRLVQSLRASIERHLSDAVTHPQRTIVQGPMTRVSDRPAFAAEVAEAGGLPFLALALMEGDDVHRLLEETAALLGPRRWGVGILGFAPERVREAQLEAIHRFRPPCALIAGGRPSQAAPLEAAGIETFLHVPSPGLLDRFLSEGARKFVFEGRECGGHVGPRGSFALWDMQVETILRYGAGLAEDERTRFFGDLHVLLAGGIHDERSSAMAAVVASPLAARGAATGVLMGTAYLFTAQAVQTGAIVPTFQEAALACNETALLETSPGHATRCADTPYVWTFLETKLRLQSEGIAQQAIWTELEQRNLGRLRLASKGLRREGDRIVEVDEDEQRAEGMVMIGQVAALRSATTTIAALHAQVTSGANAFLDRAVARLLASRDAVAASSIELAIVGMACVFPKSPELEAYWANVVAGADALGEVPSERWDPAVHWDPHSTGAHAGRRTPSKWGGFIPAIPFDPLAYGIPPSSLVGIEPVQLLALHVADRALRDAGYADRNPYRERTAVIFGAEAGSDLAMAYNFRATYRSYFGELPPELDQEIPELTEDSFPGGLSNVISGRIANRLDLRGPNYAVDAACASSLAALDLACKELASGSSDMVLCGGADLHNTVEDYFLFSSVHALSPTGKPRPFDAESDGIALGEGVGCIVLKRLAEAERDGDRIYAVVRGIGASSDGRSLGLTAPRPEGQRLAIERAYANAAIAPRQVGLVEAHGTGTVVGDRTELAAISELYADSGVAPASCAIGSVKSQIGHTKCAAGIAGVIKSSLALWTGVRPPTCAIARPNAAWDRKTNPFFFTTSALPWAAPPERRIAAVSGFGFGGTNFHVVLGAYDGAREPAHGIDAWPAELFVFHGETKTDALTGIARVEALLAANEAAGRPWRLRDLAATVAANEPSAGVPAHVAIVAGDLDDLASKLIAARTCESADGLFVRGQTQVGGRVAFLFPGQGSQRPGMLADLFVAFPRLRRLLVENPRYAAAMYPPTAFDVEERSEYHAALTDTRVAQPALGIAGLAVHDLLASLGIRPHMVGGHSYGELVALCVAGAIDRNDLIAMSQARAEAILTAAGDDPGAMAAVEATAETTRSILGPASGVVIANDNAPAQVVISGPTQAIEAAIESLARAGVSAKRLPVACGFHSPMVARAAETFVRDLEGIAIGEPAIPVWSNATASPYEGGAERIRTLLASQVAQPVCFVEQVEMMFAAGARIFIEAGPGRVLTNLVGKILAGRPHVAAACDVSGEPGLRRILSTLAELAVAGVTIDLSPLFADRRAAIVSAKDAPRRPGWVVDGHTVRTADGAYIQGGLRPARAWSAPRLPVPSTANVDTVEETVLEFLRTSRELIVSQRDVLLGYLGRDLVPAATTKNANGNGVANGNGHHPHHEPPASTRATVAIPPAPPAAPVPAQTAGAPDDVFAAVTAIVSERTGYPPAMLDRDLDLEADLSIDSIKRTEIMAALAERLKLAAPGTSLDEKSLGELSARKTLQEIVDWVGGRKSPSPPAPAARALHRWRVVPRQIAPPSTVEPPDRLRNHRIVLVADANGISGELATLLRARGAEVVEIAPGEDPGNAVDGLVYLACADTERVPVLPSAFGVVRAALAAGASRFVVATAAQAARSEFGLRADAGWRGLVRTIAREYPEVLARAVDLDPHADAERNAQIVLGELLDPDGPVVVGWNGATRFTLDFEAADLLGRNGTAPRIPQLDANSVVLLTGGARGITARVAAGLARETGCHLVLIGRTPLPADAAPDDLAAITDRTSLRRALTSRGMRDVAEVEATLARIVAERRIRTTLAELERVAASVTYRAGDVRDAKTVAACIDETMRRHGRLDVVVHGAGVIEDRLIREKSLASFERVWSTKVGGALALAAALPPGLRYFVLFASIAGAFGNRGQADYAAANDALDSLAHLLNARDGTRTVAIDWGPWSADAGGMMTPELESEYARRSIGTISADAGVNALIRELAWGERDDAQVVYACAQTAAVLFGSK